MIIETEDNQKYFITAEAIDGRISFSIGNISNPFNFTNSYYMEHQLNNINYIIRNVEWGNIKFTGKSVEVSDQLVIERPHNFKFYKKEYD